jgi:hypothetical protein
MGKKKRNGVIDKNTLATDFNELMSEDDGFDYSGEDDSSDEDDLSDEDDSSDDGNGEEETVIITDANIHKLVDKYLAGLRLPLNFYRNRNRTRHNKRDMYEWDVSRVTNMEGLFADRVFFNENLHGWDVSNVKTMKNMFNGCRLFNKRLLWGDKVRQVTNMERMFQGCEQFQRYPGDIGLADWNVENVVNMKGMFALATNFNGKISGWVVSKVENMDSMFVRCEKFNRPLDKWDVRNVKSMKSMFFNATAFNQPLLSWGRKMNESCNVAHIFDYAESMVLPTWLDRGRMNTRQQAMLKKSANLKKFKSVVRELKARPDNEEGENPRISFIGSDYREAKANFTKHVSKSLSTARRKGGCRKTKRNTKKCR